VEDLNDPTVLNDGFEDELDKDFMHEAKTI
jgi:hypothetical protein